MKARPTYDVIVIGAGPAGATAALTLARRGYRVVMLERSQHPRFHIGESFLPRTYQLLCELGLREKLEAIAHTDKPGAEFAMGHDRDPSSRFRFSQMLGNHQHYAFNIERAPFDTMLFDAAREAGAEMQQTAVKEILHLAENDVAVRTSEGTVRGRFIVDASGQSTVVARHLKLRQVLENHQKIAYFDHFEQVDRLDGDEAGSPGFAMCREGWFWMIPLNETRTSVGVVMDAHIAKQVDQPADQMLRWAIDRCPMVRNRMRRIDGDARNHVCADFSYRCEPCAGPGYFLVGDAAAFVDPIFSTGVCLSMMSAIKAADGIEAITRQGASAQRVYRGYRRFMNDSSSWFFRMIDLYYQHPFRELFLHGQGPLQMREAVITLLSGHVFPKPAWAVRWRMRLFELFVCIQKYYPLAPRRDDFSLLDADVAVSTPEQSPMPMREGSHDAACV